MIARSDELSEHLKTAEWSIPHRRALRPSHQWLGLRASSVNLVLVQAALTSMLPTTANLTSMLPTTANHTLRRSSVRPFLETSNLSGPQRWVHTGVMGNAHESPAQSISHLRGNRIPAQRPPCLPRAYFGSTTAYSRALAQNAATAQYQPYSDGKRDEYAKSRPTRTVHGPNSTMDAPSHFGAPPAILMQKEQKAQPDTVGWHKKDHGQSSSKNHNKTIDMLRPYQKKLDHSIPKTKDVRRIVQREKQSLLANETIGIQMKDQKPSFESWKESIAIVRTQYRQGISPEACVPKLVLSAKSPAWAEEICSKGTVDENADWWQTANDDTRLTIWQSSVLYLLSKHPARVPSFLLTTCVEPLPPSFQVSNVLHLMAYIISRTDHHEKRDHRQELWKVYQILSERYQSTRIPVSFRFLLMHAPMSQRTELYEVFEHNKHYMGPAALIDAARYVANRNQWRLALTFLEDAVKGGARASDSGFQAAGLAILRVAASRERASPVGTIVVSTLLRLGYQLDIRVFNILMVNAVEEGNFLVAWQIWTMLDEIDIKPDASSFTTILKACRLGNWRDLSKIILERARMEGFVEASAHLKTEVLLAGVMSKELRQQRDWKLKFDILLTAYREFWSVKPLEDLGVSIEAPAPVSNDLHQGDWQTPGSGTMPGPHVVTIMLQNFMTIAPIAQTEAVYQRFLHLRSTGHPEILELASTVHFWDALATAHFQPCQSHEQASKSLEAFLNLINDMRTPPDLSQSLHPPISATGYCQPGLPLFSKMLSKCTRSGHLDLAEQVREAAQQHSVRLSKADWLKLLSAYARAQDYNGIIETLHAMVGAGLHLMQTIGTALVPLKDRKAFLSAVEQRLEPKLQKDIRQLLLFGMHYGVAQRRIAKNPKVKRTFDPWPANKINPKAKQALSAAARNKFRLAFRRKRPVELDPLLANMLDEDTIRALEATKTDVRGVARKRQQEDIAKLDDI